MTVYGVADVAQEVGVTPVTVHQWIRGGKLVARKIGREWVITEEAVRFFIAGGEPRSRRSMRGR